MLQMRTELTVMHKGFQCRLHAGVFSIFSGGAEVSVQH